MQTPTQPSPMLKAIDLMRVNLDELDLKDLEAHASELSQKAYGTRSQGSGGYVIETAASAAVRTASPSLLPPSAYRKGVNFAGATSRPIPQPRFGM